MILYSSCQKNENEITQKNKPSTEIELRSYNQEDCGFIESFCEHRLADYVQAPHEIKPIEECPELPCFTAEDDDGSALKVLPVKIFDGTTAVYLEDDTVAYFIINTNHRAFTGKTIDRFIPNEVNALLDINYRDITDIQKVKEDIGASSEVYLSEYATGLFRVKSTTTGGGGTTAALIRYCDYYRTSDVNSFIEVFFDEDVDYDYIRDIVESAFDQASDDIECQLDGTYGTGNSYEKCKYNCIDPRCIVDYFLDPDSFLSEEEQQRIVVRYLNEAIGLSDGDMDFSMDPTNFASIIEIYNDLHYSPDLTSCENADCSKGASSAAKIRLLTEGYSLTSDDKSTLDDFYAALYCQDPDTYECFTEARDFAQMDEILLIASLELETGCTVEQVALSYAEYTCKAFQTVDPEQEVVNTSYLDCYYYPYLAELRPEVSPGTWLKLAKVLKKAFKAFKQGKDLTKGSTWKDIIFEVFDKALVLADGQVTPDEIIEAILDLGLGINFDDIKWIKRFLGFASDAHKLTPSQIDASLDWGTDTYNKLKHRMEHFQEYGWIPSAGNLDDIADQYKTLVKQIMNTDPVKTVKRNVKGQEIIQYLHYYDGKPVLISIYNEGNLVGTVKQTVVINEDLLQYLLALEDYIP